MTTEIYSGVPAGGMITAFPLRAFSLTPSDETEYDDGISVRANVAGNVVVEPYWGEGAQAPSGYSATTVTFALAAGEFVPVVVKRVLSTGTTATGLIAVY